MLVGVSGELNDGTAVTFDPNNTAQAMTLLASNDFSSMFSGIWGIELGSVAAGQIEFAISGGQVHSVLQLSNATLSGALNSNAGNVNQSTIENSISGIPTGSFGFSVVANSFLTQGLSSTSYDVSNRAGLSGLAAGYGYSEDLSGNQTFTWEVPNPSGGRPTSLSTVTIAAVPEPTGGLLLLGAAGAFLAVRRRS